jgi:hypothetical protein
MAECSRCKAETQLHVNGVPVCPDCDDAATHLQKQPTLRVPTAAVACSALNSDSDPNLSIDGPAAGE